ncbi:LOW QUALITY PROTEIN: olfactory receptor 52B2-like [Sarcophilus harrisii]
MIENNFTIFHPTVFILLGIPGLESYHIWLSIPFCLMYVTAVLGNGALILVVLTERSLHEPMYIFLSMLAGTDILLSTTTVPKALAIFWFHAGEIAFDACITQMFFIHVAFVAESGILLAMAFDRYVAICTPLRYTTILTPIMIGKISLAIWGRSIGTIFPIIFLLKRLPYCKTNIIPHSYCEHIGVARLACADITINIWYGFSVPMASVLVDVALIGISYTMILHAVFRLPSQEARHKALNTCGSHIGVILLFFIPSFFTFLTHRFGKNIPHHVHILLANLYVLIPPMLNPIIYGAKTKQIRDSMTHMFSVMAKGTCWSLQGNTSCQHHGQQKHLLNAHGGGKCGTLFDVQVKRDPSLHQPMYLLLAMLAINDLGIFPVLFPKTLAVLWFDLKETEFNACLTQMFFVHALAGFETGILVAMALDRYIAICRPLHYTAILTPQVLLGIAVMVVMRAVLLISFCPILIKLRLTSFHSTVVAHSYCEHMAVVKLAVGDIVNKFYGLAVILSLCWSDISFISTSYVLIFRAVLRLPGKEARVKAVNTYTAHITIIVLSYSLALFSFLAHRYGHHVAPYVHILLANIYLLVPLVVNPIVYGVKTKEICIRVLTMFSLQRQRLKS